MRARLSLLLVIGVAGVAVLVGQALAGRATRGQTGSGIPCGTAGLVAQTAVAGGTSYMLPTTKKWKVTSWSTQAGANGGQMALVVFRFEGDSYRVVVATEVETLTPNALNTFKLGAGHHRWDIKRGDLIGAWCSADADGAFATGSDGDSFNFLPSASVPLAGWHVTFPAPSTTGRRANISATVVTRT
jgi:hypothetical protein